MMVTNKPNAHGATAFENSPLTIFEMDNIGLPLGERKAGLEIKQIKKTNFTQCYEV